MTALVVAAWIAIALTLVVVAFLAMALRVSVRIDGLALRARVGLGVVEASFAFPERIVLVHLWRWRILRRTLDGGGHDVARSGRPTRATTDAPRRDSTRARGLLAKVRTMRTVRAYTAIARDVVRRVQVDTCEGHLHIATPDPSLTGMAYGVAQGVRALLCEPHRSNVTVSADFVDDLPYGRASIAFRVRVAVLALAAWRVFRLERGRSRRGTRVAVTSGRRDHATN